MWLCVSIGVKKWSVSDLKRKQLVKDAILSKAMYQTMMFTAYNVPKTHRVDWVVIMVDSKIVQDDTQTSSFKSTDNRLTLHGWTTGILK